MEGASTSSRADGLICEVSFNIKILKFSPLADPKLIFYLLKSHVLWGGKAFSGNNNIFPHHSFSDLFSCGLTELLFVDSVYPQEACGVIKNLGGKK